MFVNLAILVLAPGEPNAADWRAESCSAVACRLFRWRNVPPTVWPPNSPNRIISIWSTRRCCLGQEVYWCQQFNWRTRTTYLNRLSWPTDKRSTWTLHMEDPPAPNQLQDQQEPNANVQHEEIFPKRTLSHSLEHENTHSLSSSLFKPAVRHTHKHPRVCISLSSSRNVCQGCHSRTHSHSYYQHTTHQRKHIHCVALRVRNTKIYTSFSGVRREEEREMAESREEPRGRLDRPLVMLLLCAMQMTKGGRSGGAEYGRRLFTWRCGWFAGCLVVVRIKACHIFTEHCLLVWLGFETWEDSEDLLDSSAQLSGQQESSLRSLRSAFFFTLQFRKTLANRFVWKWVWPPFYRQYYY